MFAQVKLGRLNTILVSKLGSEDSALSVHSVKEQFGFARQIWEWFIAIAHRLVDDLCVCACAFTLGNDRGRSLPSIFIVLSYKENKWKLFSFK